LRDAVCHFYHFYHVLMFTETLRLEVSRSITADCGKPVTIHCAVLSSRNGLSIKHMEWFKPQTYCSVNSKGNLSQQNSSGNFRCDYEKGNLSLHFPKWRPEQSENFLCKVRTNQGVETKDTRVETREHWEGVEAVWSSDFPTCTFKQVCPTGHVEWFQDSTKIADQFIVNNYTDDDGMVKIYSYLKTHEQNKLYNCSLKSARSGQYLTSALIHSP
ncbi:hypothetical protein NL108_005116, partial [Boleophthalmus pectinirostris]